MADSDEGLFSTKGHGMVGNGLRRGANFGSGKLGKALKFVGKVGLGVAGAVGGGTFKAAKLGVKAADKVGGAAVDGTTAMAKSAWKMSNETNGLKNPVGYAGHLADKVGDKALRYSRESYKYNPLTGKVDHMEGKMRLTGMGKVAVFGLGSVGAASTISDNNEARSMGQLDSTPTSATPDFGRSYVKSFANNGGADGSLVFALHNNRH